MDFQDLSRDAPEYEPNEHTIECISSSVLGAINAVEGSGTAGLISELDSHANMVVLGRHAFIFESIGRTCSVKPFSDEFGVASNIPIVDGAVAYD